MENNHQNVTPVQNLEWRASSQVESTSYDAVKKELTVKFRNGGVYSYEGVPVEKYEELKKTDSIGKFLNREIKGSYEFQKLN